MQWAVEFNTISVVIGLWRCVVGLPWVCVSKDIIANGTGLETDHVLTLTAVWYLCATSVTVVNTSKRSRTDPV